MTMELTAEIKMLLQDAAEKLKGSDRRTFMATAVSMLGRGGQRRAERELGWDRTTIRKGTRELASGLACLDAFRLRGRHNVETRLPHLREDIRSVVDSQSQIDPTFQTQRLYTRLSAAEVRQQLIEQKQYATEQLPTVQTFNTKLNELNYRLKTVAKTRPLKKIAETDAIFTQLNVVHQRSAQEESILRVSLDAKATVKVGLFSRGGRSRLSVAAWDHDFTPDVTLTPFGLWLPHLQELFVYLTTSKVTSDFGSCGLKGDIAKTAC
jgi:Rhodopirellula transposase DDE domain